MKLPVKYTIEKVTVYPDRALVTCLGETHVEPGLTSLIFNELPLSLEPDSLRIKGKGKGRVQILGLDFKVQHFAQTPSEQAKELELYLDQLNDDLKALDDQDAVWEGQLAHLQGLRNATEQYAKGLSRGQSSVDDQRSLMHFIKEQDQEFRAAQREIGKERRDVKRQISKIERELKELRSQRVRKRFQVLVNVKVTEAGDFWPELEYIVGNAGWKPIYEVRLEEENRIKIDLFAQVAQKTGQEWEDVQLSVSTARPALNKHLPELKPWFVDERQVYRAGKNMIRATSLEPVHAPSPQSEEAPTDAKGAEQTLAQADVAQAKISEEGASRSFNVTGSWDILSDGSPIKTLLTRYSTDVDVDYFTIPKYANAAYRRAKIQNHSDSSLLSGDASLYLGREYIGNSRIEFTPVDGELELIMGVDEQVVVTREMVKRQVDKRLLRENRVQKYGYQIEINNLKQSKIEIEVQDHIPISKHERIKVKLDSVNPEPKEKNELNLLKWQLHLDPESERKIKYEFVLEYPSDFNISGIRE